MDLKLDLTYTKPQIEIFHKDTHVKFKTITKGRRFGLTQGGAHAYIEWAIEGMPCLWVDTIAPNIDRYFERYFQPALHKNGINYDWNVQKKILKLYNGYIDFKSADRPENIEGFGYMKIFCNETGIILKNDYLYTNTLLPMLMDYPDSQLFAGGVPKGKVKKDGSEHKFYTLWKQEGENHKNYQYSSYDNPLLNAEDIQLLEKEIAVMDEQMVLQEIYGEFIEASGTNPFATQYETARHEQEVEYQEDKPIYVSMDFNLNPFGFIFEHIWRDAKGFHWHQFDEANIENGNLDMGIDYIRDHYGHRTASMVITGDAMGKNRDFGQKDNASYYERIQRALRLRSSQIKVYANPVHSNSRNDVNYVLAHHPDYKINPVSCPNSCRDMRIVQCDAFGQIIKKDRKNLAQKADHLDCKRYSINAHAKEWIKNHMKGKV